MLQIPNVTLCTVTSDMMDLTARAMNICQSHAEFASSIFVSDHQIPEGKWQREYVPDMGDLNGYNRFVSQNLPKYCNTDFLILIQWDGYILDPNAWRDEFLEYDYIGAVWPWHLTNRVGNGGFCIRSKKFMEAVAAMNFPPLEEFYSDDVNPCRVWRKELEGKGIRFAPEDLANKFAYERGIPIEPTFGFHGQFTMWQHVDDSEMIDMVKHFGERQSLRSDYVELLMTYCAQRKFRVAKAFYRNLRRFREPKEIEGRIYELYGQNEVTLLTTSICQRFER